VGFCPIILICLVFYFKLCPVLVLPGCGVPKIQYKIFSILIIQVKTQRLICSVLLSYHE
jgi:hypothetical protein